MGNACSASKKKTSAPSQSQAIQSPRPPPSNNNNNNNTPSNLPPTYNPYQAQKIDELPPKQESPQKNEGEQLINVYYPVNNVPLPPPPPEVRRNEQDEEVMEEEEEGGNEKVNVEKVGGTEVQEVGRNLEEIDFNNEGGEREEVGEIFQNDNQENQNQSYQYNNGTYGEEEEENGNGGYGEEEEDYDGKNARKSMAGPMLMALKAENVNDFFATPALKEEDNEGEANKEFKNVNNETTDHENNSVGEQYVEQIPQVIYKL